MSISISDILLILGVFIAFVLGPLVAIYMVVKEVKKSEKSKNESENEEG